MIMQTLARYFSIVFLRSIALVFGLVFVLIYLADFVEMLRRADDIKGASFLYIAFLSLLRTPSIAEKILPFAILFGAMGTFLTLSRKLELVVVRSVGVSALQFLLAPLLLATLLGIASVTVYNPLAALAKQHADRMETKLFAKQAGSNASSRLWIRQKSGDHQSIIHADFSSDNGSELSGVSAFEFSADGSFTDRIDASTASLRPGHWQLRDARILVPGKPTVAHATYALLTNLTVAQVTQSFGDPDSVPFWNLQSLIRETQSAGLDATSYRLHFESLLAEPVLLAAMVMVAAAFSLRFFRFGGIARTVAGGVIAGFVLYVASVLVGSLGEAGVIGVSLAAWTPAITGGMLGTLALLYQEDG